MTDNTPNIYPFTRFVDADRALEWLSEAFGFEPTEVHRGEDGRVVHAEVHLGPGIVMFGPGDPAEQGIYVAVADADAHYERAKSAGAEIVRDIGDTDYGSREYAARDPEGHVWSFGTYRPTVSGHE